jgi:radical SAM superfamily enzyme YgiQ (UPF0313 family)
MASASPDAPAAEADGRTLTYSELDELSNQLARNLRRHRSHNDHGLVAALSLDNAVDQAIASTAVARAGGTVVALPSEDSSDLVPHLDTIGASIVIYNSAQSSTDMRQRLDEGRMSLKPSMGLRRESIVDLDTINPPNRRVVNYEKYSQYPNEAVVKNCLSLQATRGCPYGCAYCHKIMTKKHFMRSADSMLDEVEMYYKMGVRRFAFVDDIFNLQKKNSADFFKGVLKRKMDIQIAFPNGLRGDILKKDYIDLMVEAGTSNICMALETASPRLQKLVDKQMDLDRLHVNMDYLCGTHPQVMLGLFLMLGFPTETEEEAMMTLDFLDELKWVHFPEYHILKIYPDTDMSRLAISLGVNEEDINHSQALAFHELPDTLPFSKAFARRMQAKFLKYFMNRERIASVLPHQTKIMSESEIAILYNSFLPNQIDNMDSLLDAYGLQRTDVGGGECLPEETFEIPDLNASLAKAFPKPEPKKDALRVLLLDVTQFFSEELLHAFTPFVEPPLGPMYLLTHLEKELGSAVNGKLLKTFIDFDNYEELARQLDEFQPDVIGIRTMSYFKEFFHEVVDTIRAMGWTIPILTGGPHATADHKDCLRNPNVDLVVWAEGEDTLLDLCKTMIDNDRQWPTTEVLKTIPGVVIRPDEVDPCGTHILGIDLDLVGALPRNQYSEGPRETSGSVPTLAQLTNPGLTKQSTTSVRESAVAPSESIRLDSTSASAPNGVVEEIIEIWTEILGSPPASLDDDFFDLGGDSLKALLMAQEIERRMGKEVLLTDVLEQLTVGELSNFVASL